MELAERRTTEASRQRRHANGWTGRFEMFGLRRQRVCRVDPFDG